MSDQLTYLVPYDFSPVADAAMHYAVTIAEHNDDIVQLLHIVKRESEVAEAEAKFVKVLEGLEPELLMRVRTKVTVGDIFTDIAKMAEFTESKLVVMGTHGAKGLQKLFGSHAIKVITSSKTPFVVVQNKAPKKAIEHIVMPVGLAKESLTITRLAIDLAKKFNAKIHIVVKRQTDEFLIHTIRANIILVKKEFAKEGIDFDITIFEKDKPFYDAVAEYGHNIGVDMYAFAYFKESILLDTFPQHLITNTDEVPVLVCNAKEIGSVSSQYSFITI